VKAPFLRTVKELGTIKCGFQNRLGEASEQKNLCSNRNLLKGVSFVALSLHCVRFEVMTAVRIKVSIFCNGTLCCRMPKSWKKGRAGEHFFFTVTPNISGSSVRNFINVKILALIALKQLPGFLENLWTLAIFHLLAIIMLISSLALQSFKFGLGSPHERRPFCSVQNLHLCG
jgi:hypothetical protein